MTLLVAGACALASGASAATIYVDRNLGGACPGNYSAQARACSGGAAQAFKTIQEAANVVVAGDVVQIRGGVYDHPTNGSDNFVLITRSGTASAPITFESYPGEMATLKGWGFEDRDLNGDGDADGPNNGGSGTLMYVTGSYLRFRGLEVTNSNKYGVVIGGSNNLLENMIVHDNWLSNIRLSGNSHIARYNDIYRSRHGGGIGVSTEATQSATANDNRIEYNLIYDHGFEPSGQKVLPFNGDPVGGGNSDGAGTSKTCHDEAPAGGNLCQRTLFLGNIVWHNADDGFDVSFANSRFENNVAFNNGPQGNRGMKTLRYVAGNTYVGNVVFGNGDVGFEPRANSTLFAHHQLALRNGRIGLDIKVQGTNQADFYNNVGYGHTQIDMQASGDDRTNWKGLAQGDPRLVNSNPVINTNLPAGTTATRWQFLWDQFKAAFTPAAGSPLIDRGTVVAGLHCATADDDPGSPMNPSAACRHWSGAAPDIGAFEYKGGGGPGLPSFSVGDASVTEGNSGSTSLVFTVSLSAASTQTVTVNYATANSSATAGSDYTAGSGTLSFPAGTTSKTITVAVLGDTAAEGDEYFFANLSSAAGATVADGQGKGTIRNDDTAAVSLRVNDVTVTEGNAGSVSAVFTVTLSAASSQTVTVDYATANGTATAGSDYTAVAGNLSFAPNTTSKTLTVAVTGDAAVEGNETFLVNLTNPAGATLADGQGQGTITNDEAAASSLRVNDVTVTEGNAGSVSAVFTVTLSAASTQTVTVAYATANGTATAGSDYTAAAGTLSFAPNTTSKTLTVAVTGDTTVEGNETFLVNLTNPAGASLADGQGQGTITNDDGAALPSLRINDVTVTEGNAGSVSAVFTVTLSAASTQTVTVAYATANGTATAGSDYTAAAGTLSFAPSTTTKTFTVAVTGDTAVEASETFIVNLTSPVGATLADAQGQGTITNDDGTAVSLSVSTTTVVPGQTVQAVVANGPGNAKDWVGLYAKGTSNLALLDWKYLNNSRTSSATGLNSATLSFAMPSVPKVYEFRFFASNSYAQIATSPSVTVQTSTSAATLTVSKTTAARGSTIQVTVTNGSGNPRDWTAMYAASGADTSYLDWKYLNGSRTPPTTGLTTATLTYTLPGTPGVYNFRLFANNTILKAATSSNVTVQ